MSDSLKGKVIIITGSSRGIGAAAARIASERGAKVVVHGKTDSDALSAIANKLHAYKIVCDVADKEAVENAVNSVVEKFGRVDGVINSAGIAMSKPFLELEDDDWMAEFQVNLLGTVHFCQAAIPYMQQQKSGAIVNVSSLRGLADYSSVRNMPYGISKAGVVSLTHGLANGFGPDVRVNCVAPGGTLTDMAENWPDEVRRKYTEDAALQRAAQPEEVAKLMLFLVSDDASAITGETVSADTGYRTYGK